MVSQIGYQLLFCVIFGLFPSQCEGQPGLGLGQPGRGLGQPGRGLGQPGRGLGQPGRGRQPAVRCNPSCALGETCSMVRQGTRAPTAGCINMREAVMLHLAMQGGPTGPGTGMSVPSTLGAQQNNIPGMQWGSNTQGGQGGGGFGQRFNQGIVGTPATMFNQNLPNSLAIGGPGAQFPGGQTGFGGAPGGFPQAGQTGGAPGGGFGAPGGEFGAPGGGFGAPPGFIDPTTGQGAGFGAGQFPRVNDQQGQGQGQGQGTGTTNHLHDRSGSGNSGVDVGSGFSGQDQPLQGEVSSIQEDTFGYYYILYPVSGQSGIRVNITKGGFCSRSTQPENPRCAYDCRSDSQCPGDQKCCPRGCSLGCSLVTNPPEPPPQAPVGPPSGLRSQESGGGGMRDAAPVDGPSFAECQRIACDDQSTCEALYRSRGGRSLHCYLSYDCGFQVCQTVQ